MFKIYYIVIQKNLKLKFRLYSYSNPGSATRLDDFVLAYLDDILIFSTSFEEYIIYVRKVLTRLREKDLPVKLSKCVFYKDTMPFLGYIVSRNGLALDPVKI